MFRNFSIRNLFTRHRRDDTPADAITPKRHHAAMIAICVGHSRQGDRSGAVSIGGVSEWQYNRSVAKHMQTALQAIGIGSRIYQDYPRRGYNAAIDWLASQLRSDGATAAIELHFNAASPAANGHEWLHWPTSPRGTALATAFNVEFSATFPQIRRRGLLPRRAGGGSRFLQSTHCPAIIAEPFFGSNLSDWREFDGRQQELGQCYARAISRWMQ
jgi:N-acetylmuramoyl-L-alanine amidase